MLTIAAVIWDVAVSVYRYRLAEEGRRELQGAPFLRTLAPACPTRHVAITILFAWHCESVFTPA